MRSNDTTPLPDGVWGDAEDMFDGLSDGVGGAYSYGGIFALVYRKFATQLLTIILLKSGNGSATGCFLQPIRVRCRLS